MSAPESNNSATASSAPTYPPQSDADRAALLTYIRETPIAYGPWRNLKGLYKQVEGDTSADPQILGALLGRMDRAPLTASAPQQNIDFGGLQGVASLRIAGNKGYVLGSRASAWHNVDTLAVFDLETPDPLKPKPLGTATTVRGVDRVMLCGETLACVFHSGGWGGSGKITVYDISTDTPQKRGSLPAGNARHLAAAHPFLFVTVAEDKFEGLRIYSLEDPNDPTLMGELRLDGAMGVVCSDDGRFACVAVPKTGFSWRSLPKKGGLRVVDTSDPTHPRLVGAADFADIRSGAIRGRYAYVGARASNQFHIFDLSDLTSPRHVATYKTLGGRVPSCVFFRGNYAYLGLEYGPVEVVDVRDPASPKTVGEIAFNHVQQMAFHGEHGYLMPNYGLPGVYNVSNGEKAVRVGTPPSPETMGYMKRRARRLLKGLAGRDPNRFAEVAFNTLREAGKGNAAVDTRSEWVAMDLLYGGTDRFVQTHHGRGGYRLNGPTSLRLRARDERNPGAWDARPDLLREILETTALPWQTYEFAVKALRVNREALPEFLDPSVLNRFLSSPSPLLMRMGARQVGKRIEAGRAVSPELAADAFVLSGRTARGRIGIWLADSSKEGAREKFGTRLAKRLSDAVQSAPDKPLSRRMASALTLLARSLPETVPTTKLLSLVGPALLARRSELSEWIHGALGRTETVKDAIQALDSLLPLPDDLRGPALEALAGAMKGKKFTEDAARSLVWDDGWKAAAGWRLLVASGTEAPVFATLWNELLDLTQETPALKTAMSSADALLALSRSGISVDAIAAKLTERPFLVALLSAQTFKVVTQRAPAEMTLRLIAAAPDDLWTRVREGWLDNLREGIGLTEFWMSVEKALDNDIDDRLLRRVVQDEEVARTILDVEDVPALLSIKEPAFGPLLGRVYRRHEERMFPRDSELLILAATHMLPEVREPALARVRQVGMGLPFALRLLESEVPPSVTVGQAFFDGAFAEGRAFDHALALCDSPQKSVREMGRRYVVSNWNGLPREKLYRALFENPEPDVQAFVAQLLNDEPTEAVPQETAEQFDGVVLRTGHKARRAKELVKERQTETPTVDMETLLALARGKGTPRDAEWALSQLARLALYGQQIDGLSIDGVAGV